MYPRADSAQAVTCMAMYMHVWWGTSVPIQRTRTQRQLPSRASTVRTRTFEPRPQVCDACPNVPRTAAEAWWCSHHMVAGSAVAVGVVVMAVAVMCMSQARRKHSGWQFVVHSIYGA